MDNRREFNQLLKDCTESINTYKSYVVNINDDLDDNSTSPGSVYSKRANALIRAHFKFRKIISIVDMQLMKELAEDALVDLDICIYQFGNKNMLDDWIKTKATFDKAMKNINVDIRQKEQFVCTNGAPTYAKKKNKSRKPVRRETYSISRVGINPSKRLGPPIKKRNGNRGLDEFQKQQSFWEIFLNDYVRYIKANGNKAKNENGGTYTKRSAS